MKATARLVQKIREGLSVRGFYFLLDHEMHHTAPRHEEALLHSLGALARRNGWRMIDARNCSAHLFLPAGSPKRAHSHASLLRGTVR